MVKHILVAVGSGSSDAALSAGIERARESGAKLTLLHVVDTMPWWAVSAGEYGCGDLLLAVERHAREVGQHCNEAIQQAALEGRAKTLIVPLKGLSIGRVIASTAHELDADLIVIGAGNESTWLFWKTRISESVARCTHRAILLATMTPAAKKPRDESRVPLRAHAN